MLVTVSPAVLWEADFLLCFPKLDKNIREILWELILFPFVCAPKKKNKHAMRQSERENTDICAVFHV